MVRIFNFIDSKYHKMLRDLDYRFWVDPFQFR